MKAMKSASQSSYSSARSSGDASTRRRTGSTREKRRIKKSPVNCWQKREWRNCMRKGYGTRGDAANSMRNRCMLSAPKGYLTMPRTLFSLALLSLFASTVLAQVTVEPPEPRHGEPLKIVLRGAWRDSCVPVVDDV